MTINKKDILVVCIVAAVGITYALGLYQSNKTYYGDIAFSKPFGYRFHSVQFDQKQTKMNTIKNFLGVYNSFDKSDKSIMFIYQNLYTFSETSILINFYENERLLNFTEDKHCIYSINKEMSKSGKMQIKVQPLDNNTTFSISGDNEYIINGFVNSICKGDIL